MTLLQLSHNFSSNFPSVLLCWDPVTENPHLLLKIDPKKAEDQGKVWNVWAQNLRLGVLAHWFVLYPNSEPEKSHTSQTLIFSGHLDMTWAVLVKEFEIWQYLS